MLNRAYLFVSLTVAALALSGPAAAEGGPYFGFDFSLGSGSGFETDSRDNDVPSACDLHFHPNNQLPTSLSSYCAAATGGDAWSSRFDNATGPIVSLSIGWRAPPFRWEGEYVNSDSVYNEVADLQGVFNEAADLQTAGRQTIDKTENELIEAYENIGTIRTYGLLLNGYYDIPVRSDPRWTFWGGGGIGYVGVEVDYRAIFTRNHDATKIITGEAEGLSGAELTAFRTALAGTTTVGVAQLESVNFAWQLMLGIDYQINEYVSLGSKIRYLQLGEVEDGTEWNQLRSHAPTNQPDGNTRIRYLVNTDDLDIFGIGMSIKYAF